MALEDRPNYIDAVVTCEGNLHDPDFSTKFQIIVDKLKSLLSPSAKENILHVRKIEPWNSVRVTISIPKEAAQRLKHLAEQGSNVLKQLGILSVQVEGDQVISLTLAGSGSEPTHVTLQHESELSFPLGSSSAGGSYNFLSGVSNPPTLQRQASSTPAASVPYAVAGPSGVRFPASVRSSSSPSFRSPNVVAPTGESVPNFSQRAPGPGIPPRIPLAGPFSYSSMVHAAAHTVQRSDTNTNSVQVASDNLSSVSNITSNNRENSSVLSSMSNTGKVSVGNAYIIGKPSHVQNAGTQFHNVQQTTPVTGVLLTSQSAESVGAKFVFSNNSNSHSSANIAISQANPLVLPASSSSVQPGANPSLQIQLVNVTNSALPPPPYPYQQKQPSATLQIRQQPPQLPAQIAAPSDKPMSSPLLVNLLQHGDTNSGASVPNAGSPRPQSLSLSKNQAQMSMPPPLTVASSLDGQQYYRRQIPAQEQRQHRSLSLDSTNSPQRQEEQNAFHDLPFTASQSLSAITYSSSSPMTNSNNEQFQFAMPLPCDVPSSSRNIAEQQQLRTMTITHQNSAPSSQNSTAYRLMNPTEVVAFHQQQQHKFQPMIRLQQQQQQGQTMSDQSGSYQKVQQFVQAPTDQNSSLKESVHLQNQPQVRTQQSQHMFNGPVSSQQQYSSPPNIAQPNSSTPSFSVHSSDKSVAPITSITISNSQSQQNVAGSSVTGSVVGTSGSGNRFFGNAYSTSHTNLATAVHVTKIPVQQAISTLTDQQQIHSFVPLGAVNVSSASVPNSVSNTTIVQQITAGNSSTPSTPVDTEFAFSQPKQIVKSEDGSGDKQRAEAITKNLPSQGSTKNALVPSIPTSVASFRSRGPTPGVRAPHGVVGVGGGKPRLLLLNPLTGHLEPKPPSESSSESDDEKFGKTGSRAFTGKRTGLGKGKPAEALASGMSSLSSTFGKQQAGSISEQAKELQRQILLLQQQEQLLLQQQHRLHQQPAPSTASAGTASTSTAPGGRKFAAEEGKQDSLSSSGEKIKLRLKLEKHEPVLSPAYKVNVSFLKSEEKAGASGTASQGNASVTSLNPSSVPPTSAASDQPRVPPLHISLRGKNAAVVVSPRRDEREHSSNVESVNELNVSANISDIVSATGVNSNCVDGHVSVPTPAANLKSKAKSRAKVSDILSSNLSQTKAKTPRPKNNFPTGSSGKNPMNKSVPGKIRATKSNSFSATNMKADFPEHKSGVNSQPKKQKKSRRKSEHSEVKSTIVAPVFKEPKSYLDIVDGFGKHDAVESSGATPPVDDSELLQLLSDSAASEESDTNKTDSTNLPNSTKDAGKPEIRTALAPAVVTDIDKRAEPSTVELTTPNPLATYNASMNKDLCPTEIKNSSTLETIHNPSKITSLRSEEDDSDAKDKQIVTESEGSGPGKETVEHSSEMGETEESSVLVVLKSLKDSLVTTSIKEQSCTIEGFPAEPKSKIPKLPILTPVPPENLAQSESGELAKTVDVPGGKDDSSSGAPSLDKVDTAINPDAPIIPKQEDKNSEVCTDDKSGSNLLAVNALEGTTIDPSAGKFPKSKVDDGAKCLSVTKGELEITQICKTQVTAIAVPESSSSKSADYSHSATNVFTYEAPSTEVKPETLHLEDLPQNKVHVQAMTSSQLFNRNIAMKPIVEPSNGNAAGGEDSGIDSMDALSEKSPNQGESPVRKELEQHQLNSDKLNQYLRNSASQPVNHPEKYYDRLGTTENVVEIIPSERTKVESMEIVMDKDASCEGPSKSTNETTVATSPSQHEEQEQESSSSSQIQSEQVQSNEILLKQETVTEVNSIDEQMCAIPASAEPGPTDFVKSETDDLTGSASNVQQSEVSEETASDPHQTPPPDLESNEFTAAQARVKDSEQNSEQESSQTFKGPAAENEKQTNSSISPTEPDALVVPVEESKDEVEVLETKSSENEATKLRVTVDSNSEIEITPEKQDLHESSQIAAVVEVDDVGNEVSVEEEKVSEIDEKRDLIPGKVDRHVSINGPERMEDVDKVPDNSNFETPRNVSLSSIQKLDPISPKMKKSDTLPALSVEQGIMPQNEIVEMVQSLKKEALKEEMSDLAGSDKEKQKSGLVIGVSCSEKPMLVGETPKEIMKTSVTQATTEIKPVVAKPSSVSNPTENVTQPTTIPVSFLPRIEYSNIRQRPLLRPHVQGSTILLRPRLLDSTTRFTVGIRPELKSLPKLQPKPEDRINHEPVTPVQPESTDPEAQSSTPEPNFQPVPLGFTRSGSINLPNVIHLTRAPSGSITSMQSKVPSSIIATSTAGVVSVSLPSAAQAGKTNAPRGATVYTIHPNSTSMLPQQIQQQQQTMTLAGHKVVPIKLVAFPRHTQVGSFVGTSLSRSSPTLIEAVKTSAFRNVGSSSPVQSSTQGISAVQMSGGGNITFVPISAVPTNVSNIPGQHNPVKLLVSSSPLNVQPNLRQSVVVKSVVVGTPSANLPRGATTIKVMPSTAVNHFTKSHSPSPIPTQSSDTPVPKKADIKPEGSQKPVQTSKASAPAPSPVTGCDPGTTVKPQENTHKSDGHGGTSIYKGIHGVQLLDTSLPNTKNQDFLYQADIIHDEKDLAAVLAAESICITENGVEDSGSSAYDFTHNDYDVLPPQPIKSAIRQTSETKSPTKAEGFVPVDAAKEEDELVSSPTATIPTSPVRVLRSNSPLYTYSNRVPSARNSDHSRESSRSPSPTQDVDEEDQEIIDSFSSSESLSKPSPETELSSADKFNDHSYNQVQTAADNGNGELGPLSINIPGAEFVNADATEDKKGKRNTRSTTRIPSPDITEFRSELPKSSKKSDVVFKNSPKASPTGSIKLLSPTIGGGSGTSSARASPISNSASSTTSSSARVFAGKASKRKRQGSESSSASKEEVMSEDKLELIDLNSRPGKRRCSENAAELIKACIGIEDTPKRVNSFSRKLEDTKSRERIRKNTPTILEQNESETDSVDFSLMGKSGSRGSSEDRSSSRGSSVQRSSMKSLMREEDSLDKVIKKKDLPKNKFKTQSRSESPITVADQKEEPSKSRRSKRAAPEKSLNAIGGKKPRNVKEQGHEESTPTTGPRNEKRKTRSSAASRLL